ncbi:two-component system, chemotaxis family, CheB/CheR fusion protein [Palleronia marisminoris]|uniref:histidine kinase n=1 Tax=Palleronia marisminoris TaxID=315423 RepID=A0A1Y5RKW5_9RHOB|nr:chemotaxis protein CheB [Palleronia marisminoris]SFG24424.1 two-component system, chemotaxis family, CheB/CheR fusion protein [Palleronia marisminoris]SLN18904.1 Chemotaxis response regulator protein-glutamate methylesterase of group 3 operon [Palleronia marisminoris]
MSDDSPKGMQAGDSDSRPLFVVGIGASAGGLEALREMLSAAGRDCALAFVVVQHLDPNHDSLLAELLGRHTTLDVRQANDGETVQPGTVHIIPPGHGLSISDRRLTLTDFAQPRGLRRPIDDFFESLAEDQGENAACVILSGTGADGSAGLRAIKEHGGLCVAQDPETAKYDGMPTSAQSTGLVDFVLPPEEIIDTVQQFFQKATVDGAGGQLARTVEETLGDICSVVRTTAGHDFSGYKTSTLARRVQRRIQVLDLPDATAYLHHIRTEPDECEVLFRELLINVTRFFRDAEHFDKLRRLVIEPLVESSDSEEVRVWVPGCSSGEEAYTIAMLFAEEVRLQRRSIDIQVFATDIDERMLRIARDGIYPQAALADIPEDMRDLYTVARDGTFQIASRIRDMIRFSVHSLVRDPPFSNIDLLSCRNLLIYFDEQLQAAVLPIFHYSVRPGGKLFLGPSESLSRHDHLFHPIEPQARLFERNDARPEYPLQLRNRSDHRRTWRRNADESDGKATRVAWADNTATERILETYGPATLLVTGQGEVLGSTGKLGRYLEIAPGERNTQYAASIARPGVREAISSAVRQAARTQRRTISRDLVATSDVGRQPFDLVADPLKDGTVLLVFRERGRFDPLHEDDLDDVAPGDSHVQSLEDELRSTRARLHITVEELETANEELKSSNEEMMSMNEELQSTNEELATVNDELKDKVDELSVANADLSNFFASTALPLVVLDLDRRIRNFTGAIQSIYPLRPVDRGRPLAEMTCNIEDSDKILDVIETVIETEQDQRLQIQNQAEQRTWSLFVTPYRARDQQVAGVTLVFSELTDALQLEDDLRAEGERLRLALDVAELGVWELSRDGRHIHFDHTASSLLALDADEMPLAAFLERVPEETRRDAAGILREGSTVLPFGLTFEQANGAHSERSVRMVGRRIARNQGMRTLGVIFDVTEAEEAKRVREIMLHEMNHRVKNLFSIISGMVRIAGMSAGSVRDLVDGVTARIGALARSHNLTHQAPVGTALTLGDAVRSAIEPFDGHARIDVDGPPVEVSPETLTALSLLFHELATNAAKYGVLGPAEGRLSVTWRSGDRDEIQLDWVEHYDEPTVRQHNEMTGFGSTLMQMSAAQVDGRIDIERRPDLRRTRLTYERHS